MLQFILQRIQLLIYLWHSLLHRRILCHTLSLRNAGTLSPALRTHLRYLLRCTYACYHVLALGINQVLAVKQVLAVAGIA